MGSDIPTLDIDQSKVLREILGADLDELIADLFTRVPVALDEIEAAIKHADAAALFHTCHMLKSSSGNMGFAKFSSICEILENQGRNEALDNPASYLSALRSEFDNMQAIKAEI